MIDTPRADSAPPLFSNTVPRLPITRLRCHAPSNDPAREGKPCDSFIGDVPGWLQFVTVSKHMPDQPDGFVRGRCGNRHCRMWNVFRLIAPRRVDVYRSLEDQANGTPIDKG